MHIAYGHGTMFAQESSGRYVEQQKEKKGTRKRDRHGTRGEAGRRARRLLWPVVRYVASADAIPLMARHGGGFVLSHRV